MHQQSSPKAVYLCLLTIWGVMSASAISLDQLERDPALTPDKFTAYFANFEFHFRGEVQEPKVFLASRSGDCDDFSTLAAMVLKSKGYTPRLVAVRMPGLVHVVCYIEETQSYLDYNYRSSKRAIRCGPSLEAIAGQVAASYQTRWTSASEFTFQRGAKRLVATVLEKPTLPSARSTLATLGR